jgi:predicted house-cleaning noncanonical NTP pyrophosphatase (MazG superfamily)
MKNMKTGKVIHDFETEEYRRKLTVKLKNAIMVHWLDIKKSRSKPSFDEVISQLLAKRKAQRQNIVAYKEEKKRLHKEKKD